MQSLVGVNFRPLRKLAYCLFLTAIALPAMAVDIPGLYSTGVGNAGNNLPNGAVDPHYTLRTNFGGGYGPGAFVPTSAPEPWNTAPGNSRWIAPARQADQDFADPTNNWYIFQTTFDLTGYDHHSAVIRVLALADDGGQIFLNGFPTGVPTFPLDSPMVGSGYVINSGFVPGVNTLEFRIENYPMNGGVNPTGLRVSIEGTVHEEGLGIGYEDTLPQGLAGLAAIDFIYEGDVAITTEDANVAMLSKSCESPSLTTTVTVSHDDPVFCIHGNMRGRTNLYAVHQQDGRELRVPITVEAPTVLFFDKIVFMPGQPEVVREVQIAHPSHKPGYNHFVSPVISSKRGFRVDISIDDAGLMAISKRGSKKPVDTFRDTLPIGAETSYRLTLYPRAEGFTDLWVEAYADSWIAIESTRVLIENPDLPYAELFSLIVEARVASKTKSNANIWITESLDQYFLGEPALARETMDGFRAFVLSHTNTKRGFTQSETDVILDRVETLQIKLTAKIQ